MSTVKKAVAKGKGYSEIIVSNQVRSYADEPFFVEKEEKAKAFLRQHPIPEHVVKKQNL